MRRLKTLLLRRTEEKNTCKQQGRTNRQTDVNAGIAAATRHAALLVSNQREEVQSYSFGFPVFSLVFIGQAGGRQPMHGSSEEASLQNSSTLPRARVCTAIKRSPTEHFAGLEPQNPSSKESFVLQNLLSKALEL